MVKSLLEFEYFTVFLKNRNFTSKIKRSKVTDYAALKLMDTKNTLRYHILFIRIEAMLIVQMLQSHEIFVTGNSFFLY